MNFEQDKIKDVIYLDDVKESMINGFQNGYEQGKTTGFVKIDNHFKWLKQNLIVFGGYGGHGKSTFLYQLLLRAAILRGEKSGIFSPENLPIDYFYNDLIHTFTGESTQKEHFNQMSLNKYKESMEFVKTHFFPIYPEHDSPTPEIINDRLKELIDKEGISYCVTDPFNQLDHDWNTAGRDDKYLSSFLSKEKRFAQDNNIHKIIVAHCKGNAVFEDGILKEPNVFNLAGGAMWGNKCDDIVFIHRPYKYSDPTKKTTYFISDKIKKQRICGIPGTVTLEFDFKSNRFQEMQENNQDIPF